MCIVCCIMHVLHLHSKQTLVIKTIPTVYQCMAGMLNSLWTCYISTHTVRPSCSELSRLVRGIADHLHSNELQTILVIPAKMRGSVHKSHWVGWSRVICQVHSLAEPSQCSLLSVFCNHRCCIITFAALTCPTIFRHVSSVGQASSGGLVLYDRAEKSLYA